MKFHFACMGLVAISFFACNTMTDSSTHDAKVSALVEKDWRLVSWQYDPGLNISGVIVTDNFALLAPCVTDGISRYESDGVFIEDEGNEKCDDGNNQINSGKWSLNESQTLLTKTFDGGSPLVYTVETLNDTSLVISMLDSTLRYQEVHKVILGFSAK